MEATALLKNDHDTVRRLFQEFAEAGERSYEKKRALFRAIRLELALHARIEEEVFYPALMRIRFQGSREVVREALEEHQLFDGLVAEIDQMEPDDPRYEAKIASLRTRIEQHIALEEGEMFAQARNHLTDERLEVLGNRMEALKESLLASLG